MKIEPNKVSVFRAIEILSEDSLADDENPLPGHIEQLAFFLAGFIASSLGMEDDAGC